MATLKQRLRELRTKNKKTQKDIANLLGISESAYGYYEQGRNEPSLETIKKLSETYNVPVAYLMGENDDLTVKEPGKDTLTGDENYVAIPNKDPKIKLRSDIVKGLDKKEIADLYKDVEEYLEFRRKRILKEKEHQE